MKVKAKFINNKFGFYGGVRRRNGDVFTLDNPKDFSEVWMVKLDEKKKPGPKPKVDETGEGAE